MSTSTKTKGKLNRSIKAPVSLHLKQIFEVTKILMRKKAKEEIKAAKQRLFEAKQNLKTVKHRYDGFL